MTCIIGLTGSIASGKSTVSLMFDDFNIPVIDADKIAREVVCPGEVAYEEIIRVFGKEILRADQTLDRKQLGDLVFVNTEKRKQLNEIVHPEIRRKMIALRDRYVADGEACIVLDIPLLFESNLTHIVDKTIVVYVDEAVQLKRLMARDGYTENKARQRIKVQIPVKEKAALADKVIDNNGEKYDTFTQLQQILQEWQII